MSGDGVTLVRCAGVTHEAYVAVGELCPICVAERHAAAERSRRDRLSREHRSLGWVRMVRDEQSDDAMRNRRRKIAERKAAQRRRTVH